ncbi:MAG: hypothetical protein HYS87_00455 [Candidatus Colwellbacteria bacterium]|nr:hypothetical protein [Candidatus Colwellbacteria bacterium]
MQDGIGNGTTIVGLVARRQAGKNTFCKIAKLVYGEENVHVISTSEVLGRSLDYWRVPRTKENLQRHRVLLANTFGGDIILHKVEAELMENIGKKRLIILLCVLHSTTFALIKEYKGTLIEITAEDEVRWKRATKNGEGGITLEQFKANEEKETEQQTPIFMDQANKHIPNNGTIKQFETEARKVFASLQVKQN